MAKVPAVREDLGFVSALDYGATMDSATINAALAAIGSADIGLLVEPVDRAGNLNPWIIDANVTVPSNVTLVAGYGVLLTLQPGITWTQNGPVHAGPYTVWSVGSGTLVIPRNVRRLHEWDKTSGPDFRAGDATPTSTTQGAGGAYETIYTFPAYAGFLGATSRLIEFTVRGEITVTTILHGFGVRISIGGTPGVEMPSGAPFNTGTLNFTFRGTGHLIGSNTIRWRADTVFYIPSTQSPTLSDVGWQRTLQDTTHDYLNSDTVLIEARESGSGTEDVRIDDAVFSVVDKW